VSWANAAKFRAAIGGSFFAKHESMVPRIKSQKQKNAFFASAAAAAQLWADLRGSARLSSPPITK
jgi:hypothetical protein